ncbi:20578_t:CDS:2, partial [Dentiscutata erythropus]
NLITAGWILKPNFNSSKSIESVNVVYLVDIDIKLDTVPSSILKSINLQTPLCVQKVNEIMHKHGFPPFVSRIESIKLINSELDIKTFQSNFTFKSSKEEGIIEIHTSKIMYPNGFDITIISQNVKIPVASASPLKKINKVIENSTSKTKLIDQKTTTPQNTLKSTTPQNTIKSITPLTTPQNTIKSITPQTTPQNTLKRTTPQNTFKRTTPQNTLKSTTRQNTLKSIPVNDSNQINIRH